MEATQNNQIEVKKTDPLKRDEKGRLMKGTPPGPGRPKKTEFQREYEDLMMEMVKKDAKPILSALIKKAKTGDTPSIKEINDRVLDKPLNKTDITSAGKPLPAPILGGITQPQDEIQTDSSTKENTGSQETT